MSYNTQETSEIRVSSKIDRTALTETLLKPCTFLRRPLRHNVKSSKFAWSKKGNPDGKLFKFLYLELNAALIHYAEVYL